MNEYGDDLRDTRREYQRSVLIEHSAAPTPFKQLDIWLQEAKKAGLEDYNAFSLSTISTSDYPHSRIVLLRSQDESGLIFFTNYQSRKGKDIAANPKVGVNFYWASLERQVRVSGSAHKTTKEESDEYFAERPRESQIAAWASAQSEVLTGRDVLEQNMEKYSKKFEGMDVPRPENWGGYRIIPNYFEFWQGRPFRLHDRLIYCVDADFEWFIKRLAP